MSTEILFSKKFYRPNGDDVAVYSKELRERKDMEGATMEYGMLRFRRHILLRNYSMKNGPVTYLGRSHIYLLFLGAIFLFLPAIVGSAMAKPYPLRQVDMIFDSGLVSVIFEDEVRLVAQHYVKRTRFAGKVRINEPYVADGLNIYLYRHSHVLPRGLKHNCVAYSDFNLIMCDQKLIDAMPRALFKIGIRQSGKAFAVPLLFWLIGHEIGHVVFGHARGAYAPGEISTDRGELASVRAKTGEKYPKKSITTLTRNQVRNLNQFEVDADRFAAQGLPIKSPDDWVFFSSGGIIDAWFWEQSAVQRKSKILEKRYAAQTGVKRKVKPDTAEEIFIEVPVGQHPPIAVRLHDFLLQAKEILASFPDNLFQPVTFIPIYVGQSANFTPNTARTNLFFGGHYVGTNIPDNARAQALLDKATYFVLRALGGGNLHVPKGACRQSIPDEELAKIQQQLICEGTLFSSPVDPVAIANRCKLRKASGRPRCLAMVKLSAVQCQRLEMHRGGEGQVCVGRPDEWNNAVVEISNEFAAAKMEPPADITFLEPWMLLADYLFRRELTTLGKQHLDNWVASAAIHLAQKLLESRAVDLLTLHDSYLRANQGEYTWVRRINNMSALERVLKRADAQEALLEVQTDMVEIVVKEPNAPAALKGQRRLHLARTLRHSQSPDLGSTQAMQYVLTVSNRGAQYYLDRNQKAVEVGYLAVADFQRALLEARESGDSEQIHFTEWNYLNAISDLIYSYNVVIGHLLTDEESEEEFDGDNSYGTTDKAIAVAKQLSEKLVAEYDKTTTVKNDANFHHRVWLHALNNATLASLRREDGKTLVAVLLARKALKISEGRGDTSNHYTMLLLSTALYLNGQKGEARVFAKRTIEAFEKNTNRIFPLNSGLGMRDKVVAMEDLLKE